MRRMHPDSVPPPVTQYFSGLASVYADHRPGYPGAAIEWILGGVAGPIRIADIGCGTGISTRLLAERGHHVIGIDPNADMLEQARRQTPASLLVEFRTGRGENTGLNKDSIDLVVCAQSFHWFDALAALREFHRILREGGRLALMWNWKLTAAPGDEVDAFTVKFSALMAKAQADGAARGLRVPSEREADPTQADSFTNARRRRFPNPQSLDLNGVLGRARSASYFPRSGPVRDELESELRRLFDEYQHNGRVTLMHITEVTLADRR